MKLSRTAYLVQRVNDNTAAFDFIAVCATMEAATRAVGARKLGARFHHAHGSCFVMAKNLKTYLAKKISIRE